MNGLNSASRCHGKPLRLPALMAVHAFMSFGLWVSLPLWLHTAKTYAQTTSEAALHRHSKAASEAMRRHDYAAAEREYLALVRLAPQVAEVRSNLGLAYYLQKKYDLAEEQFEQALQWNRSLYYPNYLLARIRRPQRRFREAVALLEQALSLQPGSSEARRELAGNYVELKEFRQAIELYQQCLKNNPHDMETLYGLGLVYLDLTQESFDRVAELPKSPFTALIRARHYTAGSEWNQSEQERWRQLARIEYRRALEAAPHLPEVRVELAELELKEQNWEEAAELFEAELDVDASSYLARFGLAQAFFHLQNLDATLGYLNEAARIRPEFFDPLPAFPVSLPREKLSVVDAKIGETVGVGNFGGAFLRAVVADELGDAIQKTAARKAAQQALGAIRSQVRAARPAVPTGAEETKQMGVQLLRSKRYEAGTDLLLPLLRKTNDAPEVALAVARTLLLMKKYDSAAQVLGPYAARRKDDPELHYLLGLCYQNAAEKNIQVMMGTDPQSYRLRQIMGGTYLIQERYEAAAKQYQAALDLQPDNSDLLMSLGYVYLRQMKYPQATECFRRSVESDPRNSLAQLKLGDSLLLERKAEQAMPHLRAALDLDSSLVQAHAKLGKALGMLDRFADAVRELELASKLDEDGSIHYQLGTFYSKLGQKEKAVAALTKSQELRRQSLREQQSQVMGRDQDAGEKKEEIKSLP